MVSLSARNVNVMLGARQVLTGASMDILPGELVAVLGPNGAGKSTFLNVLSGEQEVLSGDVRIGGEELQYLSPASLACKRALMPQRASLSFPFKVRDVVAMGRDPFRTTVDASSNKIAVDWALEETDIGHLAERVYTQLSGGEQQRVQLARVLAQVWREVDEEARFLLLDEPTSSLDLAHQHSVLHLAARLAEKGVGVVAVVHDLNLAALYATRVVILSDGRVVATGSPEEVLQPLLIAEVFDLSVHRVEDPGSGRKLIVPTGNHRRGAAVIDIRRAL
ncbi:heme ABC transporter ATP-binding protein [Parvibaculaceae bacterium PLY_AMNH_Bact1]|nr:heme ABC transporter ATP-binding protein [Parvibaculaceae bacterium PLY_AMNH_Bact1]